MPERTHKVVAPKNDIINRAETTASGSACRKYAAKV